MCVIMPYTKIFWPFPWYITAIINIRDVQMELIFQKLWTCGSSFGIHTTAILVNQWPANRIFCLLLDGNSEICITFLIFHRTWCLRQKFSALSKKLTISALYPYIFIFTSGHYTDVIMGAIASQITSLTIVYSTVYSGADQRKHQSSASLAFVRGIHRGAVNSPHKWPVTRKMFPFDDVIMISALRLPTVNVITRTLQVCTAGILRLP